MNLQKIKRKIVVIHKSDRNPIYRDFLSNFNKNFNDNIKRRLRSLETKIKKALNITDLPEIEVVRDNQYVTCYNKNTDIRCVLEEVEDEKIEGLIKQNNSHTVGVKICSNKFEIINGFFELNYSIKAQEALFNILEDVMLDILMFEIYGYNSIILSVNDKKDFSARKVEFCINNGYINEVSAKMEYVSFITLARDEKQEISINKYIEIWEQFNKFIKGGIIEHSTIVKTDIIDKILKAYKYSGQTSKKQLEKLICNLSTGRYCLVRLLHRPKDKKTAKQIQVLFYGERTKVGNIKVIDFKNRYKFLKYKHLIDIFEFLV